MTTMIRRDDAVLLEIDLTRPWIETEPEDLISKLRSHSAMRWRKAIAAVHDGANSGTVRGLMLTVGGPLPLAHVQELRDAVIAFRGAGKPTLAWADSFGELANGTGRYYLASAFDEIWLHPAGTLALNGVAYRTHFLRGVLDKLDITPQIFQRHEYKGFADSLMRRSMSESLRENAQQLIDSMWAQIGPELAARRSMDLETITALVDASPQLADAALATGLVDRLGYQDEALAAIRERCGEVRLRYADQWSRPVAPVRRAASLLRRHERGVAIVDVHGDIIDGRSRRTGMSSGVGGITVGGTLLAAARNERIGAVVLRVDSGGGSALASDTMWHGVRRVREAGKPVIVSMGAVAASGGYYISCGADVIVAEGVTITGSIGVAGGKLVLAGLFERAGLSSAAVTRGSNAEIGSPWERFSEAETALIDAMMDRIYADFTAKVASGRGLAADQVDALARGRIWTGLAARDLGLVDEIGGLRAALRIARNRAGLRSDAPIRAATHVPAISRLRPPRSSEDPRAMLAAAGLGSLAGSGLAAIVAALPPQLREAAGGLDRILLAATGLTAPVSLQAHAGMELPNR